MTLPQIERFCVLIDKRNKRRLAEEGAMSRIAFVAASSKEALTAFQRLIDDLTFDEEEEIPDANLGSFGLGRM